MTLKIYGQLLRVSQWYKNGIVFLALFFSGNLFSLSLLYSSLIAFFSLSLISSTGYIINDLMDLNLDRCHPEKKYRPLASGKINKNSAIIISIFILLAGLMLALTINKYFFYMASSLFVISLFYTFLLKKILFLDVLTIAILFVMRALAGALVIQVYISPWLVLLPFFLSLFLSTGKRHADLYLLKENAPATRKTLRDYTYKITKGLMIFSTIFLIISYILYSIFGPYRGIIFTLPFALFSILRYYFLIDKGSEIARHPEKVIKDLIMMVSIILWVAITIIIIYI